ncbi:LOB domain-containing protein 35-like [Phalaenopsis equestris]|uniref:LOB domain-containing protein 35-like n=1 Tax=Phalaenopsis equestris TaxID=78828 RepID=UPI0009E367EE|nr:LOB domain-containing protein 35-like [Phalaenopsis equestris]
MKPPLPPISIPPPNYAKKQRNRAHPNPPISSPHSPSPKLNMGPLTSPSSSACAACKYQRRKCSPDCTLAPFFPAEKHLQFINAHRLFGVSNILKILKSVDESHRQEAMNSIIFQSNIRAQDPSGGCYRIILNLQRQIEATYTQLQHVLNQVAFLRSQFNPAADGAADIDAIYGLQQPQQHCNNFCFAYDVPKDLQGAHEHGINGHDNVNPIDIGNEELRQQVLFGIQGKEGREEGVDVRSLADMYGMQHGFGICKEQEDAAQNISIGSTITGLCSSMAEAKADANIIDEVQEHDLRSAASFFSLNNCDTQAI